VFFESLPLTIPEIGRNQAHMSKKAIPMFIQQVGSVTGWYARARGDS